MANKTIAELIGIRRKPGLFGVEIECEGRNLSVIDSDSWTTEHDGSLRGAYPNECCEWVLKGPLTYEKTEEALFSLEQFQKAKGAVFDFSQRTSVHVHVNVLNMTWEKYCNFLYLSLLLENVLASKCGEHRVGNRFCLRLQDAESLLDSLTYLFEVGFEGLKELGENEIRYSFMNIAATRKYGSVEFRGMEGNLDIPRILNWLTLLKNLKIAARKFDNPMHIHETFKRMDEKAFVKSITKEEFSEEVCRGTLLSFSLSYPLAYSFKGERGA